MFPCFPGELQRSNDAKGITHLASHGCRDGPLMWNGLHLWPHQKANKSMASEGSAARHDSWVDVGAIELATLPLEKTD